MSAEARLQPLVWSQAGSQPAMTGRPMGWRTIGPASSGLGEGLVGWDFLVSSCSSESLWLAGRLQAEFWCQFDSVSSNTLVQRASSLSRRLLRSEVWRTQDSTFPSPELIGELQRWDKIVSSGPWHCMWIFILFNKYKSFTPFSSQFRDIQLVNFEYIGHVVNPTLLPRSKQPNVLYAAA